MSSTTTATTASPRLFGSPTLAIIVDLVSWRDIVRLALVCREAARLTPDVALLDLPANTPQAQLARFVATRNLHRWRLKHLNPFLPRHCEALLADPHIRLHLRSLECWFTDGGLDVRLSQCTRLRHVTLWQPNPAQRPTWTFSCEDIPDAPCCHLQSLSLDGYMQLRGLAACTGVQQLELTTTMPAQPFSGLESLPVTSLHTVRVTISRHPHGTPSGGWLDALPVLAWRGNASLRLRGFHGIVRGAFGITLNCDGMSDLLAETLEHLSLRGEGYCKVIKSVNLTAFKQLRTLSLTDCHGVVFGNSHVALDTLKCWHCGFVDAERWLADCRALRHVTWVDVTSPCVERSDAPPVCVLPALMASREVKLRTLAVSAEEVALHGRLLHSATLEELKIVFAKPLPLVVAEVGCLGACPALVRLAVSVAGTVSARRGCAVELSEAGIVVFATAFPALRAICSQDASWRSCVPQRFTAQPLVHVKTLNIRNARDVDMRSLGKLLPNLNQVSFANAYHVSREVLGELPQSVETLVVSQSGLECSASRFLSRQQGAPENPLSGVRTLRVEGTVDDLAWLLQLCPGITHLQVSASRAQSRSIKSTIKAVLNRKIKVTRGE